MIPAPDWLVSEWFNSDTPLALDDLRGKVVAMEAFQMLCPGCVTEGLPLAQNIRRTFRAETVAVVGLHCVFEHHAAMTPVSLKAFLHEYRIGFPVAVDAHGKDDIPLTMAAYELRGTPSLVLIDRAGNLRASHFGSVSEMQIGAEIASLLGEPPLA